MEAQKLPVFNAPKLEADGKRAMLGTVAGVRYLLDAGDATRLAILAPDVNAKDVAQKLGRELVTRKTANPAAVRVLVKQWAMAGGGAGSPEAAKAARDAKKAAKAKEKKS